MQRTPKIFIIVSPIERLDVLSSKDKVGVFTELLYQGVSQSLFRTQISFKKINKIQGWSLMPVITTWQNLINLQLTLHNMTCKSLMPMLERLWKNIVTIGNLIQDHLFGFLEITQSVFSSVYRLSASIQQTLASATAVQVLPDIYCWNHIHMISTLKWKLTNQCLSFTL